VVGTSYTTADDEQHATLWQGSKIVDLNNLLSAEAVRAGWVLETALSVNDFGVILGVESNYITHEFGTFLLTPVPEPTSYAMLLAGLGLMGWVARRRKAYN